MGIKTIKSLIKKTIIKSLPKAIVYEIEKPFLEKVKYQYISWAHEGEDLILQNIFEKRLKDRLPGFYVDVGALHPYRFSKTHMFYLRGWRGINIDPLPGIMQRFKEVRNRDINLGIAISDKVETITYYMFNDPGVNTCSPEQVQTILDSKFEEYKIIDTKELKTQTLANILDTYLPADTSIDFLDIDVEGLDLKVLKSNNWNLYRPKVVLVEELRSSLEGSLEGLICKYMKSLDYTLFARTFSTLFFMPSTTDWETLY